MGEASYEPVTADPLGPVGQLRVVGRVLRGDHLERPQLRDDVVQRDHLEFAAPPQPLVVHPQGRLGRLTGPGELVDEPPTVEVLDRRHPRVVRIGPQIAPLHELVQRLRHRVEVGGPARRGQSGVHILRPQMHREPLRGGEARPHHLAVEGALGVVRWAKGE